MGNEGDVKTASGSSPRAEAGVTTSSAPIKLPSIASLLDWTPSDPQYPGPSSVSYSNTAHPARDYGPGPSSFRESADFGDPTTYRERTGSREDEIRAGAALRGSTSFSSSRTSVGSSLTGADGPYAYPSGLVGSPTSSFRALPQESRGRESQYGEPSRPRRRRSSSLSSRPTNLAQPAQGYQHPYGSYGWNESYATAQQVASPYSWPNPRNYYDFPRPVQRPQKRQATYLPEQSASVRDSLSDPDKPRRSSIGTTEEYNPIHAWMTSDRAYHHPNEAAQEHRPVPPLHPPATHPPASLPQHSIIQEPWRPSSASSHPVPLPGHVMDWRFSRMPFPPGPYSMREQHLSPQDQDRELDWSRRSSTGEGRPTSGRNGSPPGDAQTMNDDENDGGKYACPHCAKRFARPSSLKIHIHSHTGEKPFECKHCGRAFSVQSNLRRHLKIHSNNVPPIGTDVHGTSARAAGSSTHSAGTSAGGGSAGADSEARRGSITASLASEEADISDGGPISAVSSISSVGPALARGSPGQPPSEQPSSRESG